MVKVFSNSCRLEHGSLKTTSQLFPKPTYENSDDHFSETRCGICRPASTWSTINGSFVVVEHSVHALDQDSVSMGRRRQWCSSDVSRIPFLAGIVLVLRLLILGAARRVHQHRADAHVEGVEELNHLANILHASSLLAMACPMKWTV